MHDNLTQQFRDAMAAKGCAPAADVQIVADDEWHRYRVDGEKVPNARYKVRFDSNGFGCGVFINFKESKPHSWHSKSKVKLSPEELQERKRQLAAEKKKRAEQMQQEYDDVAKICNTVWNKAKPADHPYLKKKGMQPEGTRVASLVGVTGKPHDVLLVPMFKNKVITSLQRIWANGQKAFWEGGDVSGAYNVFAGADDDKSVLIICEGYATGWSIRKALPEHPVIVAFNSGNLEAVGKTFRKQYPDAKIVFAADNDQWTFLNKKRIEGITPSEVQGDDERWVQWRNEGRLTNVGKEKALQVAAKISARVVTADIPFDDPDKNTDFNDMDTLYGSDAIRDQILAALSANVQQDRGDSPDSLGEVAPPQNDMPDYMQQEIPPYEAEELSRLYGVEDPHPYEPADETAEGYNDREELDSDWRKELFCKDGVPRPNSLRNAQIFLQNHPRFRGMFCYDEFSDEKVVTRCPPWEKRDKFSPRSLRDEDVTELTMNLETLGISVSIQNIKKVLESVIIANRQNPAQEYFKKLEWDGRPRLNTWLRDYCGCVRDDPDYLAAIGRKWLTAIVNRVMVPGTKFDHILVIEGTQRLGKSTMLEALATVHGKRYFDDGIKAIDLPNPKIVPKFQGRLIIELAEMAGFQKMGAEEAKQVISSRVDRIIPKYSNEPVDKPRQFAFAGSINPKGGYLNDPTGNSRYWVCYATKIDMVAIEENKEQLWAEAMHCFRQGEKLWLDDEVLQETARQIQEGRVDNLPWYDDLEKLCETLNEVSYEDIWGALLITDRSRRTKQAQSDIKDIMIQLGFEYKRKQSFGKRRLMWVRSDDSPQVGQDSMNFDEEDIPL